MRGFVGLLIGLVLGAGAMYLVLRPPWAGGGTAAPADGGVAVAPHLDAGKPGKGKRPRGGGGVRAPRGGAGGAPNGGDVQAIEDNPSDEPDPFAADGRDPSAGASGPAAPPAAPVIAVSAADRVLEWRGDAVALPRATIDASSAAESRALEPGEVEQTTSSQGGTVKACVERAAANSDLRGTVTVQMLVDGSGRVTKVRVQAARYLVDHGVYDCARRAATAMHFPAVGGATIVTLPVTLS